MSLPDPSPKLPKLPFILGEAALLGIAWYLVNHPPGSVSPNTLAATTACLALLGIALGVTPFLTDHVRKHQEALDERQRSLEALATTLTTTAEQISIATNGLQQLTETLHKNLKHAEQLPHKLQDKIAEFNAQLDNARNDDREELEKELVELRSSESERLAATAEKIHRAAAELTKLDAAAHKQIAARTELLQRASDTLAQTPADTASAIAAAAAAAARELAAAQAKSLADIDARLEARTASFISTLEAALAKTTPTPPPAAPTPPTLAPDNETAPSAEASSENVASPPKRTRKARRDDSVPAETPAAETAPETPAPVPPAVDTPPADETPASSPAPSPAVSAPPSETPPPIEPAPAIEPSPVPLETIPQIEPVAPSSANPFVDAPTDEPPSPTPDTPATADTPAAETESSLPPPTAPLAANPEPVAVTDTSPPLTLSPDAAAPAQPPAESPTVQPAVDAAPRPAKKRAPKKPAEPEPSLLDSEPEVFSLSSEDDPPVTSREAMERVISSDGATRLIATAYIGIGNRLFIRGDGPGLSWDKGVPLQFVSIGKWRWETADAAAPIRFKLLKNDDTECAALGTLTLDPGHQQEVTAKF